jgi:gamma-glutamylcyclotransferase (GGCT)/AIG2-like uncharacterized protein YtfP
MSAQTLYFAYGSNLHPPQMRARCPDCEPLQPAVLEGYRLAFRGRSTRWGGGVATVLPAPGARVHGLLYRLIPADLASLDDFEGYPTVYDHLRVTVTARDGSPQEALTYRKRSGEPLAPSLRYLHQMWRNYLAFGLEQGLLVQAVGEALDPGLEPGPELALAPATTPARD